MQNSFTLDMLKQEIHEIGELVDHKIQQSIKKTNLLKDHLKAIHADSEILNHESDWLLGKLNHIRFIYKEKFAFDCQFSTSEIKAPIGRRHEFILRILIEETLNSIAEIKRGIAVAINIKSFGDICQLSITSTGMHLELQRLESIHLAESRLMKVCKLFLAEPKIEYTPNQGTISFEFNIHEV